MSAIGLLPWPLHQGFVYLSGVFSVLVPFLFDLTDGATLPLFVGTGVVLLAVGMLSRGPGGVARVLPLSVHAGVVYLLGFFLVVSPFVFGFSDEDTPLFVAIALGLLVLVVTLVTRFPGTESATEHVDGSRPSEAASSGPGTASSEEARDGGGPRSADGGSTDTPSNAGGDDVKRAPE